MRDLLTLVNQQALTNNRGVWQQGDIAGPFYRQRYLPLVPRTIPGDPPGDNLSALGNKMVQKLRVFVIYLQV